MYRNASSISELSEALRSYSRQDVKAEAVPLKRLVKMARDLTAIKHKDFEYEFREEYDDGLTLWVCPATTQDVLMNAFNNSIDAIQEKLRGKDLPEGYAGRITVEASGNHEMATIVITDNGIGFKPDSTEKLFVPYYTTKGSDKGTGLGLYGMYNIVRFHKGTIRVESEFRQWARVTITLPLATEAGMRLLDNTA